MRCAVFFLHMASAGSLGCNKLEKGLPAIFLCGDAKYLLCPWIEAGDSPVLAKSQDSVPDISYYSVASVQ
jgi:hypothetical protein